MNHLSHGPQKMKSHLLNVGLRIRKLRSEAGNVFKNLILINIRLDITSETVVFIKKKKRRYSCDF